MGKQGKNSLGRALVKDRFGSSRGKRKVDNGSMLHTTEVQDGYEWGRLNLQSVTEESSFQEFLSTAQLAGTEFQAEKLNLKLVAFGGSESVTTPESRAKTEKIHAQSKHLLRVPRRPAWNKDMTAEQLQESEKQAFLNWRRELAHLQEEDLILTPYEKNLEFWRQLWRVLERSQLLVQVIDARNPLLFRCEDLEAYAKEVGVKDLLLLLNKADLLSEPQRVAWAEYFDKQGVKVAFFSAVLAAEQTKLENAAKREQENEEAAESDNDSDDNESDSKIKPDQTMECESSDSEYELNTLQGLRDSISKLDIAVDKTANKLKNIEKKILDTVDKRPGCKVMSTEDDTTRHEVVAKTTEELSIINKTSDESLAETDNTEAMKKTVHFAPNVKSFHTSVTSADEDKKRSDATGKDRSMEDFEGISEPPTSKEDVCSTISWAEKNTSNILTREELIELLKSADCGVNGRLTVGMVGYPNVGKSSTINALMTSKKTSVSATPGKTKHFQTLLLSEDLMLCDCPGLVLPSFVCTKAEMVLHGILPIDQMREYMEAIGLLVEGLGGRRSAERRLAVLLPPAPADHPDQLPPRDLLLAYAYSRGMMTGAGTPDCARAARYILHSACQGRLPLAVPPPSMDPQFFRRVAHPPLPEAEGEEHRRQMTPQERRATKTGENADDLDKAFFMGQKLGAHSKGVAGKFGGLPTVRKMNASAPGEVAPSGKPWKDFNRHANKNKKQKLRKVYFELDKH